MGYGCLTAGGCLLVGWLLPTSVAFSNATLAALAVSGIMLATIIVRYFRTGRDLLDPLIVISASLIFYFGIHTLWLAANPERAQHAIAFPFVAGLAPSLALLGAGYLMLLLGYSVPRPAARGQAPMPSWYSTRALVGVFAIGMVGNIAAAASGGYAKTDLSGQSGSNLLIYKTLGFVAIIALVVCACQHYNARESHDRFRWPMWLMLAVLVVFALSVAEKQIAFSAIFAWVAARNYSHSYVRLRQVLIVIVIALFVVTPIVQASRGVEALQVVGSQSNLGSVETTSASIPQRIKTYFTDFPIDALSGFDIINKRTNGSESLALAYLYTPSKQSFGYGGHWLDIFTSLVPHFVWPGKPVHNDTKQFSEVYAGQSAASGNGLTVAPTLPGDLFHELRVARDPWRHVRIWHRHQACLERIIASGVERGRSDIRRRDASSRSCGAGDRKYWCDYAATAVGDSACLWSYAFGIKALDDLATEGATPDRAGDPTARRVGAEG
jgi:hypothetical protein